MNPHRGASRCIVMHRADASSFTMTHAIVVLDAGMTGT